MKLNTNNYKSLIDVLDLPNFWEDQLRINEKTANKNALRMLDDMGEKSVGSALLKKVNSHNNIQRKYAKCLFLKYSDHDSFKFLEDDFDKEFNALDEVRIHASLKEKAQEKILPQLMRWVNMANNAQYKAFLIKEIGFFKQYETAEGLLQLFKEEKDKLVKAQIVSTLATLDYKEATSTIIDDYEYNTQLVQMNIVNALGIFGGKKALSFLISIYHQTHNQEIMVAILENIHKIDASGEAIQSIKHNATNDFEQKAIAYVERI
jgi:hypothetical protein